MKGFKAISSDDKSMEDLSITIDKQGRLCLNAGMRREYIATRKERKSRANRREITDGTTETQERADAVETKYSGTPQPERAS